jgi:hypothetical protein
LLLKSVKPGNMFTVNDTAFKIDSQNVVEVYKEANNGQKGEYEICVTP